jgi:hypothetical protein
MLLELNAGQLMLIMKIGPLPDALPEASQTHWIRGFIAFHLAQHARTVMLMVPVCPESGFLSEDRRYVRASLGIARNTGVWADCCKAILQKVQR